MSQSISNKANVSQDDSGDFLVQVSEIKISMVRMSIFNFIGFFVCISMGIFMLFTILLYLDLRKDFSGNLIMFFLWSLLFLYGFNKIRKGIRYKKYIEIIEYSEEKSIKRIAEAIPIKYEAALKDLDKMIKSKILNGFKITDIQVSNDSGYTAMPKEENTKELCSMPNKNSSIVEYSDYLVQNGRVEENLRSIKLKYYAGLFLLYTFGTLLLLMIFLSILDGVIADIIISSVISVPFILLGRHIANKNSRYIRYIRLITDKGERSINKLAEAIPISYEKALSDIFYILTNGALSGFDVVEKSMTRDSNGSIAVTSSAEPQKNQQSKDTVAAPKSSPKESVVICCGCGAKNVVKADEVGICEYCEGPISYKE